MKLKVYKVFNIVLFLSLVVWCGFFNAAKIDLVTADLGRHLMNGMIFLSGNPSQIYSLLHTNLYSYTNPNFPFINHHWLTGVVFYLVYLIGGFNLLSIFYIVLTALAFAVFLDVAQKRSNLFIAILPAVLLMPIMAARKEVRPEVFTYLFCGIFYWILWHYLHKKISKIWLYFLPVIMLFWVNLHIGFIVGIGVIGVFWVDEGWYFFRKQANDFKFLTIILLITAAATLLNPSFIRGALYPLFIFRNYGYLIVENQSIVFLSRLGRVAGMYFGLYETMIVVTFLSFVAVVIRDRTKFYLPDFLLFATFAIMGADAIRDFPFFGFFAVPILSANLGIFITDLPKGIFRKCAAALSLLVAVAIGFSATQTSLAQGEMFGIGLMPQVLDSANFFKANNISGPIFNNYDDGGYLIFNLFPQEKVFVDNRPEAYPVPFFQNVYIPAQEDNAKWQALDAQYNFNAIFFFYNDATPWGQQFLVNRIQDPNWAPVYVDSYNIIFLKRNAQNAALIKEYEIPKDRFAISQQ